MRAVNVWTTNFLSPRLVSRTPPHRSAVKNTHAVELVVGGACPADRLLPFLVEWAGEDGFQEDWLLRQARSEGLAFILRPWRKHLWRQGSGCSPDGFQEALDRIQDEGLIAVQIAWERRLGRSHTATIVGGGGPHQVVSLEPPNAVGERPPGVPWGVVARVRHDYSRPVLGWEIVHSEIPRLVAVPR